MIPSLPYRRAYYADSGVQARLHEFLGGVPPDGASAVFFTSGTEWDPNHCHQRSFKEWSNRLELGAEINRSLWDSRSLLAHLDIEYVNFDCPVCAYFEDERIFEYQKPVVAAADALFSEFGLTPLHMLTGRGHHFVWRIDPGSEAFRHLSRLGSLSDSLAHLYAVNRSPDGKVVSPVLGAAFSGLGLVMEYLAHRIKVLAAGESALPVELAAIEAGACGKDREIIAIDITEYADPLCSRVIKAPFSIYLKPWQQRYLLGDEALERMAPIFVVPLNGLDVNDCVEIRRSAAAAKEFAKHCSAEIPDDSEGMEALIQNYSSSALARCHSWFFSREHDIQSSWPHTYDRMGEEALPPCVNHILAHPNDLLLRPGCVSRVVRVLLSLGWHPRHIAGLIRSKYERDFGWGNQWDRYDPATRSDFYARVFTGLFVTGVDDLVDFNCQSAREEALCFVQACGENLERFRDSAINRRKYERMGCGPFNRLFLSMEHH